MRTVNIHEAKTHLSKLIEKAAQGETTVIAKAGRPVARLTPQDAPDASSLQRLGFLAGQIEVPDDFNRMGQEEIGKLVRQKGALLWAAGNAERLPKVARKRRIPRPGPSRAV